MTQAMGWVDRLSCRKIMGGPLEGADPAVLAAEARGTTELIYT